AFIERQGIRSTPDGLGVDPEVMQAGGLLRRRTKRIANMRPCAEERVRSKAVDRVRERRELSRVEAQQTGTRAVEALGIRHPLRQVRLLAPQPVEIASRFLDGAGTLERQAVASRRSLLAQLLHQRRPLDVKQSGDAY